jgi:undecaprenyl-diphosphatase
MTWLEAIILSIVEGLTEFLPISSTGHLIITNYLLGIPKTEFVNVYIIAIQFGAILSVLILYFKRFIESWRFYYYLLIAFLPAAVVGFFVESYIDKLLNSEWVVAIALFLGGIALMYFDKWFKNPSPYQNLTEKKAFKIGILQMLAFIPGVSRSAATILGGLVVGLDRKNATEFSFFLAVPTILGAAVYKVYKHYDVLFQANNASLLIVGNVIAFITAAVAIKFFINYIVKYGFKAFGIYRIIVGGLLMLVLAYNQFLS